MSKAARARIAVCTDFSSTPGPRAVNEGDFSGEQFRNEVLEPRIREAIAANSMLEVDLDGTAGYGTSFLEEAFGGLVRESGLGLIDLKQHLVIVSKEEPYLIPDIWEYIEGAGSA